MSPGPHVALATFAGLPDLHDDDRLLLEPLARLGVRATPVRWDDERADWSSYDLVVVRSKAPVLVPTLADPNDVEIGPGEASAAELEVARAALAAVPCADPLLYARVDLVPGPDGAPLVMELEITEPSLFLSRSAGAADRFAAAIAGTVGG